MSHYNSKMEILKAKAKRVTDEAIRKGKEKEKKKGKKK
jgi:hypothetical protein